MAIDTLGANALASDSVTTAKIAADAVTSAKLAGSAVDAAALAGGVVDSTKIANNAVTSAKIVSNAVGSDEVDLTANYAFTGIHTHSTGQPAFLGTLTSEISNVIGNGTAVDISSGYAHTEHWDTANGFNASTGLWTAPTTGKYILWFKIRFNESSGITATSGVLYITTSNRDYQRLFNPANMANVGVNADYQMMVVADMDANDTARYKVFANGAGSNKIDISPDHTMFGGWLLG